MRAVWSLWTKPFEARHEIVWPSREHHLFSWALSFHTARRHFARTALVTDDEGARLLVDRLGLPFDEVSTELNALAGHDPGWWALGKVYAYRAQTEPFIHIDSDVFLWEPLPGSVTSAPVFAQCPEYFTPGTSYYKPALFERHLSEGGALWLPAEWVWYRSSGLAQRAESCGIFGGNRVDFIRHYAEQAIRLVEHPDNRAGLATLPDKFEHNILFEQYLLAACLVYHGRRAGSPYRGVEIRYLFDSIDEAFYSDQTGYTHLIASAKRNQDVARRLERRVRRDYPEYYERCVRPAAGRAQAPASVG